MAVARAHPRSLAITGRVGVSVRGPADVDADLRFEHDHVTVVLDELPSASGGSGAGSDGGGGGARGGTGSALERARQTVATIDRFLHRVDFDATVVVGGRVLARMGPGVRPSLSARLLGLGPIELHGVSAVRAWLGV